ncbi:MAG: carbamoyltransferase [Cyclobacteriaceae bacterium]|nr:carbamoyltransferase [Cyclobacteriaceae bacterium]
MYILGISAYYHDSAACIIRNGEILAAAQEERFSRMKHDPRFPAHAIRYCLQEAGITIHDVSRIAFYDKPLLKFERLLESYFSYAPKGFRSFVMSMPVWIKEKLFFRDMLVGELTKFGITRKEIESKGLLFPEHHLSHAASAFYPSPFRKAAYLTVDGVGEYATTSYGIGEGSKMQVLSEIHFPHSLGLLYSAFTYYCGFRVNSGEYKLMGLAPYGEPVYKQLIYDHLITVFEDGSYRLNTQYFQYEYGLKMITEAFEVVFGGPARKPETKIEKRHMDLAASIQVVTEEIVLRMCRHIRKVTDCENLVMAGGVALNCVANGKIWKEGIFKNIFIQPAAGDAGGALGAALAAYYLHEGGERPVELSDSMRGSLLGNQITRNEIQRLEERHGAVSHVSRSEQDLVEKVAKLISDGNIIGWVQGRMEFGPRALGNRSILGDPRNREMQRTMNLKIKFRESFRPFAPIVLAERVQDYFEFTGDSPYMLMVAPVRADLRLGEPRLRFESLDAINEVRSTLPSITHVDYSARLQTVDQQRNPRLHKLVSAFEKLTGCGVLVNTSFNVRGEPIVSTAEDAYRCFMRSNIDYLVIDHHIFAKTEQPAWKDDDTWKKEFVLD